MVPPSHPYARKDNGSHGNSTRGMRRQPTRLRLDRDGDVDMCGRVNKSVRRGRHHKTADPRHQPAVSTFSHTHQPQSIPSEERPRCRRTEERCVSIRRNASRMESSASTPHGDSAKRRQAPRVAQIHRGKLRLAEVQVKGLKRSKASENQDGGISELVTFLERKASERKKPLKVRKTRVEGDAVVLYVSKNEVDGLNILNNFTFAGAKLSIRKLASMETKAESDTENIEMSDPEKSPVDVRVLCKDFLARRYNADTKFLDLSALSTDTEVASTGMFDNEVRAKKFFDALMTVADNQFTSKADKDAAVISVSLANNSIRDSRTVASLGQTFPAIRNLDLSHNDLQTPYDLDALQANLKSLEHLLIVDNPKLEQSSNIGRICRMFISLRKLDNITVRELPPKGWAQPSEGKSEEDVEKERRAQELGKVTGMTLEYCGECLQQVGWELDAAWERFSAFRSELPTEAFVQQKALDL